MSQAVERSADDVPVRRVPHRSVPQDLLALPPLRAIIRLALPTTGVMLIAATSNVLYTYYVSRLGPEAIAAVSRRPSSRTILALPAVS